VRGDLDRARRHIGPIARAGLRHDVDVDGKDSPDEAEGDESRDKV